MRATNKRVAGIMRGLSLRIFRSQIVSMGQLAVYDMLYPSLYTFAIHLYTKEPYNAVFYKFNSRLIKITKQMKISVFRQEALSDVIF